MMKHKTRKQQLKRRNSESLGSDFGDYLSFWHRYLKNRIYAPFSFFEKGKDVVVNGLYRKRGKYAQPILHLGTMATMFAVVILAPVVYNQSRGDFGGENQNVLGAVSAEEVSFYTIQAEEVRQMRGGEVTTHIVKEGETIVSVAEQYGLQQETIIWENDLDEDDDLEVGQELQILPIDGVRHKVAKGETVESVGEEYGLQDAQVQAIVDFPFNDFANNETFELAVGQYLMVPGGVEKATVITPTATYANTLTPNAGAVSATGGFVWPASGSISQGYYFYHKAIDIAGSGAILAADSGTVTASGWDSSGYGNRVVIDHGNGTVTLYAHLASLQVVAGQTVNKGDVLGIMGSTGRSTGRHLHFEIRRDSVLLNPLDYLR